tara:strand:+ start:28 stop:771 length:744 start_codon:yes stop_codon:yes gene_type:complete
MAKTLILIPSRLSAKRLPGKPLLKINGISIVLHVYKKALESKIGEVYVATEDQKIYDEITSNGGKSILTSNCHKTGTDRIFEAYKKLKLKNIDFILNIQGDEPFINIKDIKNLDYHSKKLKSDMSTLACKINEKSNYNDKNIVKVITKSNLSSNKFSKAKGFYRILENFEKNNSYHHIGIYQYKVSILEKIVSLQQSENEIKENLEQLRAIDNNIDIDVILANASTLGIDTKEEYEQAKKLFDKKDK